MQARTIEEEPPHPGVTDVDELFHCHRRAAPHCLVDLRKAYELATIIYANESPTNLHGQAGSQPEIYMQRIKMCSTHQVEGPHRAKGTPPQPDPLPRRVPVVLEVSDPQSPQPRGLRGQLLHPVGCSMLLSPIPVLQRSALCPPVLQPGIIGAQRADELHGLWCCGLLVAHHNAAAPQLHGPCRTLIWHPAVNPARLCHLLAT